MSTHRWGQVSLAGQLHLEQKTASRNRRVPSRVIDKDYLEPGELEWGRWSRRVDQGPLPDLPPLTPKAHVSTAKPGLVSAPPPKVGSLSRPLFSACHHYSSLLLACCDRWLSIAYWECWSRAFKALEALGNTVTL